MDLEQLIEVEVTKVDLSTLEVKDQLNPDFWHNFQLNRTAHKKMLRIGSFFFQNLDFDEEVKYTDIIFTGSLASYTWSKYSDVDVHIIMDFSQIDTNLELVGDLLRTKSSNWNNRHDIEIFGYPVEIFIENVDEGRHANGVYSLVKDKWIQKPKPQQLEIDRRSIRNKARGLIRSIDKVDSLIKDQKFEEALALARTTKDRIRRTRQAGLDTSGELSIENLVFKVLRRSNEIERLSDLTIQAYDQLMSIDQMEE